MTFKEYLDYSKEVSERDEKLHEEYLQKVERNTERLNKNIELLDQHHTDINVAVNQLCLDVVENDYSGFESLPVCPELEEIEEEDFSDGYTQAKDNLRILLDMYKTMDQLRLKNYNDIINISVEKKNFFGVYNNYITETPVFYKDLKSVIKDDVDIFNFYIYSEGKLQSKGDIIDIMIKEDLTTDIILQAFNKSEWYTAKEVHEALIHDDDYNNIIGHVNDYNEVTKVTSFLIEKINIKDKHDTLLSAKKIIKGRRIW